MARTLPLRTVKAASAGDCAEACKNLVFSSYRVKRTALFGKFPRHLIEIPREFHEYYPPDTVASR